MYPFTCSGATTDLIWRGWEGGERSHTETERRGDNRDRETERDREREQGNKKTHRHRQIERTMRDEGRREERDYRDGERDNERGRYKVSPGSPASEETPRTPLPTETWRPLL